jgi:hypothetical protein
MAHGLHHRESVACLTQGCGAEGMPAQVWHQLGVQSAADAGVLEAVLNRVQVTSFAATGASREEPAWPAWPGQPPGTRELQYCFDLAE